MGFPYLGDPSNVFIPVLLREAQVLVQAKSHIVAVQTVGCEAEVQKVLFECSGDGRLSGGAEAGEPDCKAALLAECVAFATREGWVPGDVAGRCVSLCACIAGHGGAACVAIVTSECAGCQEGREEPKTGPRERAQEGYKVQPRDFCDSYAEPGHECRSRRRSLASPKFTSGHDVLAQGPPVRQRLHIDLIPLRSDMASFVTGHYQPHFSKIDTFKNRAVDGPSNAPDEASTVSIV